MAVAKSYFEEHLSHNDYYAKDEIEPGRWVGLGAERLGLVEGQPIDKDAFLNLCDNLHPVTKNTLTQRLNAEDNRRVFFDFTCSAPKSVSILAMTMDDKRIIRAHQRAARFAIKELERYAATRIRGGKVANKDRQTANLLGAEFLHNSSRALDPQLHTHFTLFNATWDATENRWKALQTGDMFATIRYGSEVYRNELARQLHAMGYTTHPATNGFQVDGVTDEVCQRFSKRSAQRDAKIAEMEKELGRRLDNNEISHAVHKTRSKKLKGVSTAEVRASQLAQLSADELAALQAVRQAAQGMPITAKEQVNERQALTHSIAHVFERQSVVRVEEVYRHALVKGRGSMDLDALKQTVQQAPELVQVGHEVSTRDILETELFLIHAMNGGKEKVAPIAPEFKPHPKLGADQNQALRLVLQSPDQFSGIRGLAGTGKSTALTELDRGFKQGGFNALICAATASAADVLRQDGFRDAVTLQRLLVDKNLQATVDKNSVIVLDEAGAVGIDDMKKVFSLAVEKQARLVFSGDTGQHSPVVRGDALRILEEHSRYSFGELTEIRRQKRTDYRQVVELAADKKPQAAFDRLHAMGDVEEPDHLYDAAADAYLAALDKGQTALIVCPTWDEIDRVTQKVRSRLKDNATVGKEDSTFNVLESMRWTAAQKRDVRLYSQGQVLLFHQPTGDFSQNETARVIGTGKDFVEVQRENSKKIHRFRPLKGTSFDVCTEHQIEVAPGDRLLLQGNRKEERLINGQVVEVAAVKDGRITLKGGREIPKNYRKFCHGYALTSHASQGKTVDAVVVVASSRSLPAINSKQFYVSVSRGRETCRVFTDDLALLRQRIGRADDRKAAVELDAIGKALEKHGLLPTIPNRRKTENETETESSKSTQKTAVVAVMERGRTMRPLRQLARSAMLTGRTRGINRLAQLAKQFERWRQITQKMIAAVMQKTEKAIEKVRAPMTLSKLRTRIMEQERRAPHRDRGRSRDFGPEM